MGEMFIRIRLLACAGSVPGRNQGQNGRHNKSNVTQFPVALTKSAVAGGQVRDSLNLVLIGLVRGVWQTPWREAARAGT